jgi:hypothetical protein
MHAHEMSRDELSSFPNFRLVFQNAQPRSISYQNEGLEILADGNFVRDRCTLPLHKIGSRNRLRRLFAFVNELRRIAGEQACSARMSDTDLGGSRRTAERARGPWLFQTARRR